jgi:hypothetical protein
MAPSREEIEVGTAARRTTERATPASSDHVAAEDVASQILEAMNNGEGNRALYLLSRELGGDPLTEELVIVNPETGHPLGYLIPAETRDSLHTLAELQAIDDDDCPAIAPADRVGRAS